LDNRQNQEAPVPQKPQKDNKRWIPLLLLGILLVLVLINTSTILSPIGTLLSIFTPVIIGLVIAYFVNFFLRFFEYKLHNKIKRRRLNRAISMVLSYVLMLAIIGGIFLLIVPELVTSIKEFSNNAMGFITDTLNRINQFLDKFNWEFVDTFQEQYLSSPDKLFNRLRDFVVNFFENEDGSSKLTDIIFNAAGVAVDALVNVFVGLFISVYVLLSKERLNAGFHRVLRALLPRKAEDKVLYYVGQAHTKIGGYMVGKAMDSMMVMLVCMLLFFLFDIPYFMLIAVIIGVTDFIPFFGPFLGAIPSGVIIFLADPAKLILFVLLILVVQQIDGNLIAPIILGEKTGLSSLGVIIAITVMSDIMGIAGMLIGVPIFALLMVILDDFIKARLEKKGEPTALRRYYPAHSFIKPHDETKEDRTLTQRFVGWVASVETEVAGVDYTPSKRHSIGRGIRIFFLGIGHFFQRLFAVKPIPEDQTTPAFRDIAQRGMATNRTFWRTFFLSIFTLLLYPFHLIDHMAQTTNIACRKDGKRTWGLLPFVLFSVITLGIFPLIWNCKLIVRMRDYCAEHGVKCVVSRRFYLLWSLPGLLTVVGPFIACARVLKAYCQMCTLYNSLHTFPLSADEIRAAEIELREMAESYKQRKQHKQRRSLLEDIIQPHQQLNDNSSLISRDSTATIDNDHDPKQITIDDKTELHVDVTE
jgi:predicted PurR-regulated permease PerM